MNEFEKGVATHIGENALIKIQSYTIGIAGAGGLGSNCSFNLVRSGFKKFIIVDFDQVEYSNLNRQFFFNNQVGKQKVEMLKTNLLAINPDIQIKTYNQKITGQNLVSFFMDCDIIVEAFDKAVYKKMIVEEYMNKDKLLVAASGIAGWGKSDNIKIHKIKDNFYIVGDMISQESKTMPCLSPMVNIAAAKQADVIINYVLEQIRS